MYTCMKTQNELRASQNEPQVSSTCEVRRRAQQPAAERPAAAQELTEVVVGQVCVPSHVAPQQPKRFLQEASLPQASRGKARWKQWGRAPGRHKAKAATTAAVASSHDEGSSSERAEKPPLSKCRTKHRQRPCSRRGPREPKPKTSLHPKSRTSKEHAKPKESK